MDHPVFGDVDLNESEGVLWDVVEEHLDEAEFGIEQFERALEHPTRTLKDLARYPEERLLAQIDALVVGGSAVRDGLLLPQLREVSSLEPARIVAIALTLLSSDRHDLVRPLFAHAKPQVRKAVVRACELAANPALDLWLVERLRIPCEPHETASIVDALNVRGIAPPPLMQWLQSEHTELVAACARAAVHGDAGVYLPVVEHLLESSDESVQLAALVTALTWNSRQAWSVCEQLALDPHKPHPLCMAVYAALGGRREHTRLVDLLSKSKHRSQVLFALTFAGNAALAPVLLECVSGSDPLEAKLAAQAMAVLTGIDLLEDAYVAAEPSEESTDDDALRALPSLDDDDLDADLVPVPVEALPTPNAEAVTAFWNANAASFDRSHRHLGPSGYALDRVVEYLVHAPLGVRHVVALALSFQVRGGIRINTRVFSCAQRMQLQLSGASRTGVSLRQFSAW